MQVPRRYTLLYIFGILNDELQHFIILLNICIPALSKCVVTTVSMVATYWQNVPNLIQFR